LRKLRIVQKLFSLLLIAAVGALSLVAPASATTPTFKVTTVGTVTAGTAQTFTITATSDGLAPNEDFEDQKIVTITATDGVVTGDGGAPPVDGSEAVPLTFTLGVAEFTVNFSSTGTKTITATEGDLTGTLEVTVEAAPVVVVTPTKLLIAPKVAGEPVVDVDKVFTVSAVDGDNAVDETFAGAKLVTITAIDGVVTRADGAGTDDLGAIPLTFTAGVAEFTVNFSSVDAKTITATQGGLTGTLEVTVEAAVEETPAAPAAPAPATPAAPAPAAPAPAVCCAPKPGFFSGKKWTITVDDAGVSSLDINLAKSQAGKNVSFYKRTKQGKLILLDEEQRLGKNGKASITTDKLLRTGQKVRVQVDGKFRSTVTMP
jgi:alpha-L-fucosidase 2